ncbi:hypothetical protein DDJ38_30475, partial [Klebsiella pneumoniae]
ANSFAFVVIKIGLSMLLYLVLGLALLYVSSRTDMARAETPGTAAGAAVSSAARAATSAAVAAVADESVVCAHGEARRGKAARGAKLWVLRGTCRRRSLTACSGPRARAMFADARLPAAQAPAARLLEVRPLVPLPPFVVLAKSGPSARRLAGQARSG